MRPEVECVPLPQVLRRNVMAKVFGPGQIGQVRIGEHGLVSLVDVMPATVPDGYACDYAVVEAARCSTGKGLKTPPEDMHLLRYLMRHRHWTPFEMVEFKFCMHLPIFVARQIIRHRTACLAGDVELHFDLPGGIERRGNQKYTLTVREVFDRFQPTVNQVSSQQGDPNFKRHRVQQMRLRCLNEADMEPSHTRVVDVWQSGVKPVFEVTLADGSSCRMSADHLCRTSRGWKRLRDVAELPDAGASSWRCRALFATIGPGRGAGVEQFLPEPQPDAEVWRPVRDWEDLYEVSDQGRVRRVGVGQGATVGLVKKATVSGGRLCVSLSRAGRTRTFQVQTLVLSAFGGPRPDGMECCHNDGNALNCWASNLRWDTLAENANDRIRHGGTTRLCVSFVPVVDVRYVGREMTYDLEVEGPWHNFVAGGAVVHNSVNEFSARYAEVPDEFWTPEQWRGQGTANKQGGEEPIEYAPLQYTCDLCAPYLPAEQVAFEEYKRRIASGVSREMARSCLPVSTYTRWFWKCDLRNVLHFLSLRLDPHAQREVRDYADAMLALIEPLVPWTIEAWKDYEFESMKLSRTEIDALRDQLRGVTTPLVGTERERAEWRAKLQRLLA